VQTRSIVKGPIEIFFSYSHKDEELRNQLATHLGNLQRQRVISVWHDRRISPGSDWAGEIDRRLNQAQVIILLVSADFIDSDYAYGMEMARAMDRHKAGEARVIPVILRPVDWKDLPFSKLQALPKDGKAITTWTNIDEAFLDVARGIRSAIEGFDHREEKAPDSTKFQGDMKRDKVKWVMVLRTTFEEMDEATIGAITDHLRKLSGDTELTITRIVPGSLKIYFEGSEEGVNKLRTLFYTKRLANICGIEVLDMYSDLGELRIDRECEIESFSDKDVSVLKVTGRITIQTAPDFGNKMCDAITSGSKKVIVDFRDLEYIGSYGICCIIQAINASKRSKCKFEIWNVGFFEDKLESNKYGSSETNIFSILKKAFVMPE
jgi:anti-anti-sigma factor